MNYPVFELLEVLVATAESPSLVDAAKKLGISQPAISVKLKQLQESVPLPLFDLLGKRKSLTHYGRSLYEIARKQSHRLGCEYEELNRTYAKAENLTLRIGGRREIIERIMTRLIFPGKLEFHILSTAQATEQLLNQKIDIALVYKAPDSTELIAKKLFDSGCVLSVHQKWLKGKKLDNSLIRDPVFLTSTPCILYDHNGHLFRNWSDYVGVKFAALKVRAISQDWTLIQHLVEAGHGYAVVPDSVCYSDQKVVSIEMPLKIVPKYSFFALFHRSLLQFEAFDTLLKFQRH